MAIKRFIYLTYLEAVEHNCDLMRFYGESRIGIFDKTLIESALARPKHAALYESADVIRQAATLCFGLIKNHPWLGGNKRTATHLTQIFLELNGFVLNFGLIEIIELSLNVESDVWQTDEIENWLRSRVERI
ncbi:MAG: type II toxin-antitoxin system death-on-curing family toxin [Acidobacteria bacterium]|nr:type II toxin-antitoxin system death-on-curing family toxin [Acidobacteriota bacterium]